MTLVFKVGSKGPVFSLTSTIKDNGIHGQALPFKSAIPCKCILLTEKLWQIGKTNGFPSVSGAARSGQPPVVPSEGTAVISSRFISEIGKLFHVNSSRES